MDQWDETTQDAIELAAATRRATIALETAILSLENMLSTDIDKENRRSLEPLRAAAHERLMSVDRAFNTVETHLAALLNTLDRAPGAPATTRIRADLHAIGEHLHKNGKIATAATYEKLIHCLQVGGYRKALVAYGDMIQNVIACNRRFEERVTHFLREAAEGEMVAILTQKSHPKARFSYQNDQMQLEAMWRSACDFLQGLALYGLELARIEKEQRNRFGTEAE